MSFDIISVVGLGYVGLPIATLFASCKKKVIGVDTNQCLINDINSGYINIIEPNLRSMIVDVINRGLLIVVNQPVPADIFLIAVPTPLYNNYEPNISYMENAILSIASVLQPGNLVILESTVPVGTTEKMSRLLSHARPDLTFPQQAGEEADVNVAYCPERALPGNIIIELIENNRIIGGMTSTCSKRASELYSIFVVGDCITTNVRTAEMCKLVENSFRDVNIAFANELSIICTQQNINVGELIKLANYHPRVNILQPGPGVGGHCIPIDPWFIVDQNPKQTKLIRAARQVNNYKSIWISNQIKEKIKNYLYLNKKNINNITIACFGLSFKSNIDDLRESPPLYIIKLMTHWYFKPIFIVEPHINILPKYLNELCVLTDMNQALANSDILVILVDHYQFRTIDLSINNQHFVIDIRGM